MDRKELEAKSIPELEDLAKAEQLKELAKIKHLSKEGLVARLIPKTRKKK